MAEQSVTLEPGESKEVTFEATPSKAKTYQVTVDGLSGSFKAIGVPDLRVVSLSVYGVPPPLAVVGNLIDITVRVTNYGTARGSKTIRCQVTGLEVMTKTVTLDPGKSTVFSFPRFTATETGTLNVTVNGLSKSIEVYEAAYRVGVGIYDETANYLEGTVIIDGTSYPTTRYWSGELPTGTHTFNLIVPSGYEFIRWEIYDWATLELILQKSARQFSLNIDKHIFMQAVVRPL